MSWEPSNLRERGPDPFPGSLTSTFLERGWYFIAEQPAPAPHLAHPKGCAVPRIVLATVPRVSRSCEHFPDGFDLNLPPRREAGPPNHHDDKVDSDQ